MKSALEILAKSYVEDEKCTSNCIEANEESEDESRSPHAVPCPDEDCLCWRCEFARALGET